MEERTEGERGRGINGEGKVEIGGEEEVEERRGRRKQRGGTKEGEGRGGQGGQGWVQRAGQG